MISDDFLPFEAMKRNGASPDDAYLAAVREGRDWTFCIRMLRHVFGMSLVEAREVLMHPRKRPIH